LGVADQKVRLWSWEGENMVGFFDRPLQKKLEKSGKGVKKADEGGKFFGEHRPELFCFNKRIKTKGPKKGDMRDRQSGEIYLAFAPRPMAIVQS